MSPQFEAISAREPLPGSRLVVLGNQWSRRSELAERARGMGCQVITGQLDARAIEIPPRTADAEAGAESSSWADVDTIVLIAEETEEGWQALIETIRLDAVGPPVVVLGPGAGATWRGRALTAGAFVCGSLEAPDEELRSLLAAAIRYRSLEKEINLLRMECERICLGLLKSYGQAASSLKDSNEEVHALQESLREIRNRIIRAFV